MKIRKFKNGNIRLTVEKRYDLNDSGEVAEKVYHDDMFMADLCINFFEGNPYILDYNTGRVYSYGNPYENPLTALLRELKESGEIRLYPLSKAESREIIKELLS